MGGRAAAGSRAARAADAIVVFAGGVGESGQAGGGEQERVKQAVDLYKRRLCRRADLLVGLRVYASEAEAMKALAIGQRRSGDAIVLEQRARNTYENVAFVAADPRSPAAGSAILLVSSPYHMRRALLAWRKVAPDVAVDRRRRRRDASSTSTAAAPRSSRFAASLQEYVGHRLLLVARLDLSA